jgi:hypothetical protein
MVFLKLIMTTGLKKIKKGITLPPTPVVLPICMKLAALKSRRKNAFKMPGWNYVSHGRCPNMYLPEIA